MIHQDYSKFYLILWVMQSNFKNKELLRLLLNCLMVIYGLKCKIKAVALKKKSKKLKLVKNNLVKNILHLTIKKVKTNKV
jgi:hypothetical protein